MVISGCRPIYQIGWLILPKHILFCVQQKVFVWYLTTFQIIHTLPAQVIHPVEICKQCIKHSMNDFLLTPRTKKKQRTNGPVNAHLISWPSKAQNIQNLENIWLRNDLDLQYSHTFIISISCLHLPTFRSQAAIVSENPLFSLFPIEKNK